MGNKDVASMYKYIHWIDSFIDLTFFYIELFYYLYLISTVSVRRVHGVFYGI